MNRKRIKLILLISGILVVAVGAVLFFLNFFKLLYSTSFGPNDFFSYMSPSFILFIIGTALLGSVSLMHSKDIRETKRGLSDVLKILAFFWIITGTLNAVALIVISIFFIK